MPLDPRMQALIALIKRHCPDLDNSDLTAYALTAAAHFATEPSKEPSDHSPYVTCVDCFASLAQEQHNKMAHMKRN